MKNLFDLYCVDVLVNDVKTSAKAILPNDVFVFIKNKNNSKRSMTEAIERKASFLVTSSGSDYPIPYVKVKNTYSELINIIDNIYDKAKNIFLVAVFGTNGKTTVISIIRDLLGEDKCGFISDNVIKGKYINIKNDTKILPIETIYKYLNKFYNEHLDVAFLKVPNKNYFSKYLDNLSFNAAIFTNSFEKLTVKNIKDKRKILTRIDKDGIAILNRDDIFYKKLRTSCKCHVLTYGRNKYSNLRILSFKEEDGKTVINYKYKNEKFTIESPLNGDFNVYNISASILYLIYLGYFLSDIRKRIYNVKVVASRCELVDYKTSYKIYLDYAHNESSVREILSYLNSIKQKRVITVLGFSGQKEKMKRVGDITQKLSDVVIFTKDVVNNRGKITNLINPDIDNYFVLPERKNAIRKALDIARKDDIVAILGKGRDNYINICGKNIIYSDILVLDEYFK